MIGSDFSARIVVFGADNRAAASASCSSASESAMPPAPRRMNRVVYVTGPHDWTSGWFASPPHVEYLRDGTWEQATGTSITPEYPCDFYATGTNTYTLTFDDVTSSGIRIAGEPTGFHQWYSAISELEVYWDR